MKNTWHKIIIILVTLFILAVAMTTCKKPLNESVRWLGSPTFTSMTNNTQTVYTVNITLGIRADGMVVWRDKE